MTTPRNPLKLFIKFGVAALVSWAVYWAALATMTRPTTPGASSWAMRGQFGDMFGAMTCLFTAMTLAGLIATIIHQGDQAQQQQETERRTDEALARQAESLRLSAEINAVNYRLSRYDVQLKGLEGGTRADKIPQYDGTMEERGHLVDRLSTERHQLTQRLDALLQKAASVAEQES